MERTSNQAVQERDSGFPMRRAFPYLLFAAVFATPVFFLIGYVYNRLIMAIWQFRLKSGQYKFWLTPEQCMAYLKKTNRYNEVKKLLASARGEAKSAAYDEYRPVLNSLAKELEQLQCLPLKNWKKFREIVARTNAFLLSFVTWCVVVLYFHLPLDDRTAGIIMSEYGRLARYLPDLISSGGNPQPPGRDLLWAVAIATFSPLAVYLPFKQFGGLLVHFYSKRPVEVNFGSVAGSLDRGEVKTIFAASAPRNTEPIIEIVDDPGPLEPEHNH